MTEKTNFNLLVIDTNEVKPDWDLLFKDKSIGSLPIQTKVISSPFINISCHRGRTCTIESEDETFEADYVVFQSNLNSSDQELTVVVEQSIQRAEKFYRVASQEIAIQTDDPKSNTMDILMWSSVLLAVICLVATTLAAFLI